MKLKDKKLFLLDMDGTIYIDDRLFDGVLEFLHGIKQRGGRYIFMTNNSSKGVDQYIEKLGGLGINALPEDFVTSVDATAAFLEKRKAEKIYAMGTDSFINQMKAMGFDVIKTPDEDVKIVLCGFDRELTYKKLEDVCRLLSTGKRDFFATNMDWVCPVDFGYVPDCGSMCFMIEKATGRKPQFIGKPAADMALLAMKRTGFSKEETLVVGDRLYTDIACGINAGIDTCFVLSGEGTLGDISETGIEPTYILDNIKELNRRIEDET